MRRLSSMSIVVVLLAGAAVAGVRAQGAAAPVAKAAETKAAEDRHRQEDFAKHRQMARAHEEAARCLESGEKETVC
jgi:hypothetical protein